MESEITTVHDLVIVLANEMRPRILRDRQRAFRRGVMYGTLYGSLLTMASYLLFSYLLHA